MPREDPERSRKLVIATERRDVRLIVVRASDALPVVDVLHVHPRAHDVGQVRAGAREGASDVPQRLRRLGIGVPGADEFPSLVRGGGAGHPDEGADADRAGVPDDRLPARPGTDVRALHPLREAWRER